MRIRRAVLLSIVNRKWIELQLPFDVAGERGVIIEGVEVSFGEISFTSRRYILKQLKRPLEMGMRISLTEVGKALQPTFDPVRNSTFEYDQQVL